MKPIKMSNQYNKEIKSIQIKFYDNDFVGAAKGALQALNLIIDLTAEPKEFILKEFKFLISYLSNINYRSGKSGYSKVDDKYWNNCEIEFLTYIPKTWFNSESVVYNFETAEIEII